MADYTHVNLREDVENASERFGLAPNMEARFARKAAGLQGGGLSYQKLGRTRSSTSSSREAAA